MSASPPARQHNTSDRRPTRLLTQNSELKPLGVWNWSLPAWAGRLADGRTYNTCPSAGICRFVCYARSGTYRFPAVKARHEANLAFVLDDPAGWEAAMNRELSTPRFTDRWIRIHDAGDFFSDDYTRAWLRIIRSHPRIMFYAYTKEVARFRRLIEPDPPENFLWVYSYGGTQDTSLDPTADRVADVFPDEDSIAVAGWSSQEASDLLAVLGPRLVGIPANRIPHFLKRLNGRRFSEWQTEVDAERADRRARSRRARLRAVGDTTGRSAEPSPLRRAA
ncbi:GP88 family protein [Haloechinothrix salitolerans]|uniref:Gene product 88 domain-containing protein n=1 Tax=Haloechinothrix salitolerans TaxID=926830 RepID=A0ABW2C6K5_9PSEU